MMHLIPSIWYPIIKDYKGFPKGRQRGSKAFFVFVLRTKTKNAPPLPEALEVKRGNEDNSMTEHNTYQIRVQGWIGKHWSSQFEGMTIMPEDMGNTPITTFTGVVPDQAALRGILNHLWDLNMTLISVLQISDPDKEKGDTDE